MERVYKRESIIFKLLPCMLITMYAVMCLIGSYVCAASNKIYHCEPLNYDFTLNANATFDSHNVKFLLYSYIYTIDSTNETNIAFYPIFYTGTAYFDKDNQKLHIKNGSCYRMLMSRIYDESNLEDIAEYFQTTCDEDFPTRDFSWLADEQYFEEDIVVLLYQNGCTTKSYYAIGSDSVYDYTKPDDVVFHPASQELATLITPQITSINFSLVLQEVLQTLLIVLPVVIFLIALMKAIKLLLRVLQNE